jgi:hypothetical protein
MVMDTTGLAYTLSRTLVGARVRVHSRTWVVARAQLDGAALSLVFEQPALHTVTIELPPTFDADVAEHRAWLLYNIEQELSACDGKM